MSYIGGACSFMAAVGIFISVKNAFFDDYNRSHKAELTGILWLIAALICFK